ncbi:hypothetical protein ANO11243_084740 [Dothideomycetidae sp. 11243]|nr:hypothetical protein ANO11243_084740 [fungal sp. No.11243]
MLGLKRAVLLLSLAIDTLAVVSIKAFVQTGDKAPTQPFTWFMTLPSPERAEDIAQLVNAKYNHNFMAELSENKQDLVVKSTRRVTEEEYKDFREFVRTKMFGDGRSKKRWAA